jgi:hypothetical protein
VTDEQMRWCVNTDCDWTEAPDGYAKVDAPADSATDSTQHGIEKSERYEAHGLPETVAVTRADEEREVFLLEVAHKGLDYELTREQADALRECLSRALSADQ